MNVFCNVLSLVGVACCRSVLRLLREPECTIRLGKGDNEYGGGGELEKSNGLLSGVRVLS